MHDNTSSKLDFPTSSQSQVTNRPSTVMKPRRISAKVKRHALDSPRRSPGFPGAHLGFWQIARIELQACKAGSI
jgi:hypothetical protein